MMRCPHCGAESLEGARFCSGCGGRLEPGPAAGARPPAPAAPPPGAAPPYAPPAAAPPYAPPPYAPPTAAPPYAPAGAAPPYPPHAHPHHQPGPLPTSALPAPQAGLLCPTCGNRTVPAAYFSRGVNVAKAVALFPFTNVVGPLVFFFLRKDRFICTVCRGILPVEAPVRFLEAFSADTTVLPPPDLTPTGAAGLDGDAPVIERRSRANQVRAWFYGFVSLGSLGVAMVDQEAAFAIVSAASGAFSIRSALRSTKLGQLAAARRHQQRTVRLLDLARDRGGRLTVTDVAGHFRIGFQEAEQVLDSVVDGRRVDMVVDPEGQVTYVFPELSRGLPAGPGRAG